MGLNKDNRASISFSEIGDADLIEILSKVNYNFAGFCKDLMRDGLRYRGLLSKNSNTQIMMPTAQPTVQPTTSVVKKLQPTVVDKEQLKKHVESKFDKL
jgi:hypothetical protein